MGGRGALDEAYPGGNISSKTATGLGDSFYKFANISRCLLIAYTN